MPTLEERNRVLRESWVDSRFRQPEPLTAGTHYSIQVLGVVEDKMLHAKPFVDVVAWWPAAKKWTITHQSTKDTEVVDCVVTVTHWQYMPPLPW